jgi:hypothetical protein
MESAACLQPIVGICVRIESGADGDDDDGADGDGDDGDDDSFGDYDYSTRST